MTVTRRSMLAGSLAGLAATRARAEDLLEPYRGPTPESRHLNALTLGSQVERLSTAGTPGRIIIINFFATWCTPCMVEMPALNYLARRRLSWLDVLAINYGENEYALRQTFRARRMSPIGDYDFPILLDTDKAVGESWGVETLPRTFILDPDGKARLTVKGLLNWTDERIVTQLHRRSRHQPA